MGGRRQVCRGRVVLVYLPQLLLLARHPIRSRPGVTLTPTVLINEAFLELAGDPKDDWRDRVPFFAFTARPVPE